MDRKPVPFNRINFTNGTHSSLSHVNHYLKMAEKLTNDPDRERRMERYTCVSCFYIPRMGGAAVTFQPCACCGQKQGYGSTNTDALCLECAKKHKLCKHCMGDIDLRERRRKWPSGPEYEVPEAPKPANSGGSGVMILPQAPKPA